MSTDLNKTAQKWNEHSTAFAGKNSGLFWWDAGPEIAYRINRNISGDPFCDYTTYTLRSYFGGSQLSHCLSLGCGTGGLERSLAKQTAFYACDAFDVSEESIKIAKLRAQDQGYENIHYAVRDINHIELPENYYDAVWVQGAMHHFYSLEHICCQIKKSLKPNGLFILNEYIGSSRFQFSSHQKDIANHCLQLLPMKYRKRVQEVKTVEKKRSMTKKGMKWFVRRLVDKIRDKSLIETFRRHYFAHSSKSIAEEEYKETIQFPSVRDVISDDPSEAIRSGDILPVVEQYFDIIEKKDLGGNILQFLLADIAGNFSKNDQQSQDLLRMLIYIEETLMHCGEFSSDFAYIVAKPK